MLRYLLPRQLLTEPDEKLKASPYGVALRDAMTKSYPLMKQAAWWSAPISLFGLLPSLFTLQVYDRVIFRSGYATLIALLAGIFLFLGIEYHLRNRRSRMLREAGAAIDHDISSALLNSMLRRPLLALESRATPAWFTLFRDVGAVRGTITGGLMISIFDLPAAAFALLLIALVALPLLPVVMLFIVILAIMAWWWADEVRAGKVEELQRSRQLDHVTAELCQARETLRVLAQDGPIISMWRKSYNAWLSESFRKNGEIEQAREITTILVVTFSVLITTVGALSVINQWMTIGGLIATGMLATKALSPIAGLASSWRSLAMATEAADRLEKVLMEPVDREPAKVDLPKPQGRMKLKQVSFSFTRESTKLLDKVDLDFGPRGLYAVVGRNGAGKSTLIKILSGLYPPTEGNVLIDEYDISQFARSELVEWISTLSQEVYWFSGELIDSLRRTAPDQTDEQIVSACRLSGAHDFISRLPNGYKTVVGEAGTGLSVGERRKLALAQLFLRKPSVLILDEPTNDLDFQSETALLNALRAISRTRTIVVVTHSVRLVSIADRVLHVSGNGKIEHDSAEVMVPKLFGVRLPSAPAAVVNRPATAEPAANAAAAS